jgi:regulatory protein
MGEPAASLRVRALRLLAGREHSRDELKRKLSGEDVEDGAVDALLDELQSKGWLSDQRLAEQAITSARGRYGPRRVLDRLRSKGVDEDELERAAAGLKREELDNARAVWAKRFGQPATNLQEKARQARFLAGRGFSSDVIRQVLGGLPEDE